MIDAPDASPVPFDRGFGRKIECRNRAGRAQARPAFFLSPDERITPIAEPGAPGLASAVAAAMMGLLSGPTEDRRS